MRIRVVPYAELRRLVSGGKATMWLELPDGSTVADALKKLGLEAGSIVSQDAEAGRLITGVDGVYATAETPLRPESELTLVTQMMGG